MRALLRARLHDSETLSECELHMPLLLSKSAFAARRGVGSSTISNWIARGRLTGAALTADGQINVEEAERQLGSTLDLSRSEGAIAVHREENAPRSEGADGPASLREKLLALELERKRRTMAAEQGVYIRADQVEAQMGRTLAQLIAAIENWIPDLVAELGGGAEELATARRSWRHFRERQADDADARALSLPEFVADAA
jgi:transposase